MNYKDKTVMLYDHGIFVEIVSAMPYSDVKDLIARLTQQMQKQDEPAASIPSAPPAQTGPAGSSLRRGQHYPR